MHLARRSYARDVHCKYGVSCTFGRVCVCVCVKFEPVFPHTRAICTIQFVERAGHEHTLHMQMIAIALAAACARCAVLSDRVVIEIRAKCFACVCVCIDLVIVPPGTRNKTSLAHSAHSRASERQLVHSVMRLHMFVRCTLSASLRVRASFTNTHAHEHCDHFRCLCVIVCSCVRWQNYAKPLKIGKPQRIKLTN